MNTKLSIAALSGLLLTLGACGKSNSDANAAVDTPSPTVESTATEAAEVTTATAPTMKSYALDDMFEGSADAPLEVIEYASVTCPGCAWFHENIYPRLKTDYIETGKVKFVFREFPTNPQQLSYIGFMMSRCSADNRGAPAYFAMVDTLFQNQQSWVGQNWQSELLKYAATTGMTEEDFKACIGRDELIDHITKTVETARAEYDVNSTPTFILNGEKMERYSSADNYFEMLDAALAAAEAQ